MLAVLLLVFASASQISEAVVHGLPAHQGQYPYVVAIYRDGNFFCTGSIICKTKILTAGHCAQVRLMDQKPECYYGIIGAVNKSSSEGEKIEFSKVVHHPDFQKEHYLNDVSVFTTKNPITFTDDIKPVCLESEDTEYGVFDRAIAMGWGKVLVDGPDPHHKHNGHPQHPEHETHYIIPDILQFVVQTVEDFEECQKVLEDDYMVPENLTDTKLCTKANETNAIKATCKGDSGGPLIHKFKDQEGKEVDVQIGITSAGSHHCGVWPTSSTRVAAYVKFIKEQTEGCNLCFKTPTKSKS